MVYHTITIHIVALYNSLMQQTNAVCVPCFWWEARQVWRLLSKPWGRWSMLWDLVVTSTLMSSWKYLALVHSLQHITWITAFFSTSQNTLHNEVLLIRLLLEQHQYPLVFTMTPTITCSLFHKKIPYLLSKLVFKEISFHQISSYAKHYLLSSNTRRKEG